MKQLLKTAQDVILAEQEGLAELARSLTIKKATGERGPHSSSVWSGQADRRFRPLWQLRR